MPDRSWRRPVPLTADHEVSAFSCGKPELDSWITERALGNQFRGATKTHVVFDDGPVIGFYALTNGAIAHNDVRGRIKRNMPNPIPAVILARMAVDEKHKRSGLGEALLQSAIETTIAAATTIGIACLIVHAKDDDARSFYLHYGFEPSPTDPLHLILLLKDIIG
jgi:GNAT superfamily N-acetyltransferase